MEEIQTGFIQGGTHEETPCPGVLVMDGAACLSTEMGVGLGMVQVKFVAVKEVELVDSETKFPGDVSPMEGRRFDFLRGFIGFSSTGVRHGIVFKVFSEWVRL